MRSRSPKRARQMREYVKQVGPFLELNPWCEWTAVGLPCGERSVVVHHQRGRFGARLLDRRYWAASCHFHNQWAEDHTGEALLCGWLLPVEAV